MRKAIINRSRLQNRLYKNQTPENLAAFEQQKNYCNRLCKRNQKEYLKNFDLRNITDNKKFWRTVKPFSGEKGGTKERIVQVEGERLIKDNAEIAQTFDDCEASRIIRK